MSLQKKSIRLASNAPFHVRALAESCDGISYVEVGVETWIHLTQILKYLDYSPEYCGAAATAFRKLTSSWIRSKAFKSDLSCFERKMNGESFISEAGFCQLIANLRRWDTQNVVLQHFWESRFYYRGEIFGTDQPTKEPVTSPDKAHFCFVCCLEDLMENFETGCDCEIPLHKNCSEMTIPSKIDSVWFCKYCSEVFDKRTLLERRKTFSGRSDFEVEAIDSYVDTPKEGSPFGSYKARWKYYPKQAISEVTLNMDILPLVRKFWREKCEKNSKAQIPDLAEQHFAQLGAGPILPERSPLLRTPPHRPRKRRLQVRKSKTVPKTEPGQPKEHPRQVLNLLSTDDDTDEEDGLTPPRKRARVAEPNDSPLFSSETASPIESKVEPMCLDEDVGMETLPMFLGYKRASLFEIMDRDKICRSQRYDECSQEVKRRKQFKRRKYLQDQASKGSTKLGRRLKKMGRLPELFLENVHRRWDVNEESNHKQVLNFLQNDWSQWEHDVASDVYVIGEIIDSDNPAVQNGKNPIHDKEYGVFAVKPIPAWTVLCEYTGIVKSGFEAEAPLNHVLKELDKTTLFSLSGKTVADMHAKDPVDVWDGNRMVIDAHEFHNEAVYINDYRENVMESPHVEEKRSGSTSWAPGESGNRKQNVGFFEVLVNGWPHVFVVSCRDIHVGDELLTDYGEEYWDNFRAITLRQKQVQTLLDERDKKIDFLLLKLSEKMNRDESAKLPEWAQERLSLLG